MRISCDKWSIRRFASRSRVARRRFFRPAEALTNVLRHAQARHAWIELSRGESVLELVVRDDGVGFDVAATHKQAAQPGRLGLLGMRERVQILRGSLEVQSEPGRGTRIRASFPLTTRLKEPPVPPVVHASYPRPAPRTRGCAFIRVLRRTYRTTLGPS
jgi:glucose-6-phosphate-specific signal transduction histidine kinase